MEVDNASFPRSLLNILRAIAQSKFVAIDLEMSGIANNKRGQNVGKPDLQQHYEEIKAAAEAFQSLQLGITCVEEDNERDFYLARPFNLFISPLAADTKNPLKIERQFSFSTSACSFLASNNFDFGKVFKNGITYLSREEETNIRKEFDNRANNLNKIPDLVIPPDDTTTYQFMAKARKTISGWIKAPKPKNDFVNIGNDDGPLNGYQRRLLFQLVRNEYPSLRIFSPQKDCGFMQVELIVAAHEEARQKNQLHNLNKNISKQKGLSLIFEALCGGNLSDIDPSWFYNRHSTQASDQPEAIQWELKEIKQRLESEITILVGHNLFTDLVYLYKTFVGALPEKVSQFQHHVNELFPIVFDTKYLASHGTSSMDPRGNLKDLLKPFKQIHIPLIVLHEEHTSYGSMINKEHEAGYDSWMTAELFVKLSAKLYADRSTFDPSLALASESLDPETDDDEEDSSETGGGAPLTPAKPTSMANNPFAVLLNINDDSPPQFPKPSKSKKSTNPKKVSKSLIPSPLRIPPLNSPFWDIYFNKLRVHAVEGGECDLAEAFYDSAEGEGEDDVIGKDGEDDDDGEDGEDSEDDGGVGDGARMGVEKEVDPALEDGCAVH